MRTILMASSAVAALLSAPAAAQVVIGTVQTAPVRTATAANGQPSAVTINAQGAVDATSGSAVTQDSASVVVNQGRAQVRDADNATGIDATAGGGGITSSGRIVVDETYRPADADSDGDLDGPFARGTNRAGIRVRGAYAGDVTVAAGGTVVVQGNDSAGIRLGGPLTGNLTQEGSVTVTGDRSVGVQTGAVTGKLRLAGTIGAVGQGASAARVDGPVAGLLEIQGTLTATGYRSVTLPADVSKLDADDLLQGGSALAVTNSVSGGIVFAVPPAATTPPVADADRDGIEDAREGTAVVTAYGAAPAVLIGGASALTVGPVAGRTDGFGLVADGSVLGSGVYAGVSGQGMVLGGQGGSVTVAGGIAVGGRVLAASNGASATALRLGAGASAPVLTVGGTLGATGGNAAAAVSTALLVDAGAGLPALRNTGTIQAVAGGADGTAVAIRDLSGTLRTVENSGLVSATGGLASAGRSIAIDLSAAGGDAVVRQAGGANIGIAGDVLLGAGNDLLDVQAGSVIGTVRLGAGDDRVVLAGASRFAGALDYGTGGGTLQVGGTSVFAGSLANAGRVAVTVGGGALSLSAPAAVGSLSVAAAGTLGVTLSQATRTAPALTVGGAASFERGATLSVAIGGLVGAEGRHQVLSTAGGIAGADGIAFSAAALPYLFKGALVAAPTGLSVDVTRRTAAELQLDRPSAQLYDAAYASLLNDAELAGAFLGIGGGEGGPATFRQTLAQLLPDQATGTFEMATAAARATARVIADPTGLLREAGNWGYWAAPVGVQLKTGSVAAGGYEVSGWGAAAGAERRVGPGQIGVSLAYLDNRQSQRANLNRVDGTQYEAAAYWRGGWGGWLTTARASAARIDFDGRRRFLGTGGTTQIDRRSDASWGAGLYSGAASVAWEGGSERFFVRPTLAVDYYRLVEDAHRDVLATATAPRGAALSVDKRTSDELAGTASLAVGLDVYNRSRSWTGKVVGENWFRLEVEGGRREVLAGALGATVAQFDGGQRFTIDPEGERSGWIGRVRAMGGSSRWRLAGEVGAEQRLGDAALSARGSLTVRM